MAQRVRALGQPDAVHEATDVLRGGAHIRDVQAMLGHVSLVTTQRYMPLVVRDLRDAMGGRRYREDVR